MIASNVARWYVHNLTFPQAPKLPGLCSVQVENRFSEKLSKTSTPLTHSFMDSPNTTAPQYKHFINVTCPSRGDDYYCYYCTAININ